MYDFDEFHQSSNWVFVAYIKINFHNCLFTLRTIFWINNQIICVKLTHFLHVTFCSKCIKIEFYSISNVKCKLETKIKSFIIITNGRKKIRFFFFLINHIITADVGINYYLLLPDNNFYFILLRLFLEKRRKIQYRMCFCMSHVYKKFIVWNTNQRRLFLKWT